MAYSSIMTVPSSAPSCADHSKVPWILPVAPSRSPAIGVAVKEALVCFLAALSDENDADRSSPSCAPR